MSAPAAPPSLPRRLQRRRTEGARSAAGGRRRPRRAHRPHPGSQLGRRRRLAAVGASQGFAWGEGSMAGWGGGAVFWRSGPIAELCCLAMHPPIRSLIVPLNPPAALPLHPSPRQYASWNGLQSPDDFYASPAAREVRPARQDSLPPLRRPCPASTHTRTRAASLRCRPALPSLPCPPRPSLCGARGGRSLARLPHLCRHHN